MAKASGVVPTLFMRLLTRWARRERAFSHPTARRLGSPVAQAVGGAFPLRDVLGDDAGRLHRGLAELGVAGDLALDALALGMQQVAQAFQFRDEVLDLGQR